MLYLLIDFGASFVKFATYDTTLNSPKFSPLYDQRVIKSPFSSKKTATRTELMKVLSDAIEPKFDGVVCCSILGGGWVDDVYHSWKSNVTKYSNHSCLVSGLFQDSPHYHVHSHHGGDTHELRLLGHIAGVPFYSSLGDTDCVINSLNIEPHEYVVNMGTGSQVISLKGDFVDVEKYIPAGRAFMCFDNFFSELGVSFFEQLERVTVKEVCNSTLCFDLNIFTQASRWRNGGEIFNIGEDNFNRSEFFASLIRCFVLQYDEFMFDDNKWKVRLTGGIPSKLPVIEEVFNVLYPDKTTVVDKTANPFQGQIKYIQEYLT